MEARGLVMGVFGSLWLGLAPSLIVLGRASVGRLRPEPGWRLLAPEGDRG